MQDEQNQNQFTSGGIDPNNQGFSTDPNQGFTNPQPQGNPPQDQTYSDQFASAPQNDQFAAAPEQQFDQQPQFDAGTTPPPSNPTDYNQGYDTNPQPFGAPEPAPTLEQPAFDQAPQDFGGEYSTADQAPAFDAGQASTQENFNPTEYQPFDQPQTDTTTPSAVPPLDDGFAKDAPAAAAPNTFQQKKTGSKVFLYGSIAVVVLLLIAMGVLSYFNFFASDTTDNTTDQTTAVVDDQAAEDDQDNSSEDENNSNDDEDVIVDDGTTGGNNTPASQARVNSDTEISKEWILQKFSTSETDLEGNCLNVTVCGNQADPDNDGANNLVEFNFGLDPLENDTDRDLVADGDELFVYFTDPTKEFSESDNFADGAEITNCYDPITTATTQMTNQRRSQIASNVTLRPLHEPTISLLQDAGATQSDIINRAVPLASCPTEDTDTQDENATDDADATDTSTDDTTDTTSDPDSL